MARGSRSVLLAAGRENESTATTGTFLAFRLTMVERGTSPMLSVPSKLLPSNPSPLAFDPGASRSFTLACPSCPSARVVRASVYDASFWSNLALVLMPLLVLAALCRGLYRIGLQPERRASDEGAEK